jgi:two-component system sensor histidine kinase/response regulator
MPETPRQFIADILVVDDAPANLQLLCGILKDRGYRVRPVPSGRLALQAAKAQPPDLILLDVNMPEMSGYQVCRLMKADETLRSIPVIFISALTEVFDKLEAFQVGGVDYVTKPFNLDEVRVRIETHLALRRLQGQLEAQNRELATANERLRTLEEARRILSQAIVHDLKSPLAALIGNAQYLLQTREVDGEVREVLGDMLASANGVHRIVLNLLDVARMEEAELVPRRQEVRVGAMLDRASATAQLYTRMTGHGLVVEGDVDAVVSVDPDLVVRVIENLLDNSLKYAPRGSSIRLVAQAAEGGGLSLRIEDMGPGVPAAQRERIFERYVRLDRDLATQARTSRGLGLAFCRIAVDAHGGKIWVEDNQPTGAAFCVNIPGATPLHVGAASGPTPQTTLEP